MRKLGIGFMGAGDVSILHGRAVQANPDARLVGLWNRSPERGAARAAQFQCRQYRDPGELVRDPEVDAVFVLTSLESHLKYARLALEAGKPVLCEKPVAGTAAEVQELKELAEKRGLPCMPGHNMIYEEGVRRAQELIRRGEVGRVVSAYVLYNIYHGDERAAAYPGVVRQILTHNLYTLIYLAGRPRRVTALKAGLNHPRELDKEDLAMVLVEMESGAIAHLCASFAADDLAGDPWTFLVKVIGTAGSTRYSYQDWVEVKKGIAHSRTYTAYQGSITNEVAHFVRMCRQGGSPLSDLGDALTAQKALEAVERSIATGRTIEVG